MTMSCYKKTDFLSCSFLLKNVSLKKEAMERVKHKSDLGLIWRSVGMLNRRVDQFVKTKQDEQDRQCVCNLTLSRVHETTISLKKQ